MTNGPLEHCGAKVSSTVAAAAAIAAMVSAIARRGSGGASPSRLSPQATVNSAAR